GLVGVKSPSVAKVNPAFLYAIWAEKDPKAAGSGALTIQNPQERINALWSLAEQWAMTDPQAAWDWGSELERTSDRDTVLRNVIGTVVGRGETSLAIAFLESMSPGQGRREALDQIADSLASSDPERAYEFVRSQTLSSEEERAYPSVL